MSIAYTRVPHVIIDRLATAGLTGIELSVMLWIIRHSWGMNHPATLRLSMRELAREINRDPEKTRKGLNHLIAMGYLRITMDNTWQINVIGVWTNRLNATGKLWQVVDWNEKSSSVQKPPALPSKRRHGIPIDKEKEKEDYSRSELLSSNNGDQNGALANRGPGETAGKTTVTNQDPESPAVRIITAFLEESKRIYPQFSCHGGEIDLWTREAKQLLDQGHRPREVAAVMLWAMEDPFWGPKIMTFSDVKRRFARLYKEAMFADKRSEKAPPPQDAGDGYVYG